ncbi:MAG: cation diffusion facilitator family transporter [Pseudomonadota bacterium]
MTDCNHTADNGASNSRRLLLAFVVIVVFMVVEVIGGILSGSLALLADATHMLTDAVALGLAASAQLIAMRPADRVLHFGYRRAQVLAAFVNGMLMAGLLVWIVIEAVRRFLSPIEIDAPLMLGVAAAGLVANIIAFLILHRPGEKDLNVRGAMLHVVGDLLGSIAAIIGALIIMTTGWVKIDPILSILVAVLIGFSAYRLLRETGLILLEGAPAHIDVKKLSDGLKQAAPKIRDVHQVRIWQITPEQPRITLHACVDCDADARNALHDAKKYLISEFGIHHSTIQIDVGGECPDGVETAENRVEELRRDQREADESYPSSTAAFVANEN